MLTPRLVQLLLLLLSTNLSLGEESIPTKAGEILELNPDNFQLALRQFPTLLVQFYAPWCPHCQELAPKFEQVAKDLVDSPVKLAQLYGDRFREFTGQQQQPVIEGYPTLVFYRSGGLLREEYDGPHEVASIVHWVSQKVRQRRQADPVLELTGQNFDDAIGEHPLLMVQFYAPWCPYCREFALVYDEMGRDLARKDSGIRLARVDATKDRSLAEWYGAKRYPTLLFFRYGVPVVYEGSRDRQAMVRWMEEKAVQREELPAKFRTEEDGGEQVLSTTVGSSRRLGPVMINLISMVMVSTVLG